MNKKKLLKKPLKTKKPIQKLPLEQKPPAAPVVQSLPAKASEPLQPPRGMRDILPAEENSWQKITSIAHRISQSFGYGRIETPILEHKTLFARGVGQGTDIVQKEMYGFHDQGGDELVLRPENTAAIARAYINHGMLNLSQPVKLWYLGPFFRRERPQAGRFRQFHQWGLEILGDAHAVLDVELILAAMTFFQEIGLTVKLQLNSIGCTECRTQFKNELVNFYRGKRELLCEHCKDRLERNPLRILDCKEPQCELLREGAPQITDFLCDLCREHFMKVLEYLDEVQIGYEMNPYLVRGLDYYNRTVFEIFVADSRQQSADSNQPTADSTIAVVEERSDKQEGEDKKIGAQAALGGGGRYDGLVELLGGRPTPAVGFSLGIERIIQALKDAGQSLPIADQPKVFVAQLGDQARRRALILARTFYEAGILTITALSKDGLKVQLEAANKAGVRYALIIGQKEVLDKTVIIRDMEAGIQEIADYGKIVGDIKKKLEL